MDSPCESLRKRTALTRTPDEERRPIRTDLGAPPFILLEDSPIESFQDAIHRIQSGLRCFTDCLEDLRTSASAPAFVPDRLRSEAVLTTISVAGSAQSSPAP